WRAQLAQRFDRGAAGRAWEMGHALLRRGIPAVRPLAFIEPIGGREPATLLVERDPDAAALCDVGRALSPSSERRLIERLGRVLRKLHALGFTHCALTAENIQVTGDRSDIRLDGLNAIERRGRVTLDDVTRQLAVLVASLPNAFRRTQGARFLCAYFGRSF